MNVVTAQLAHYITALKAVVFASMLGAAMFSGCSMQKRIDKEKVEEAVKGRDAAVTTYNRLIDDIKNSNEKALEAERRAEELAKENEKLAEDAQDKKEALDRASKDYEKKLKAAKKDPSCASLLQMEVCETLSDY